MPVRQGGAPVALAMALIAMAAPGVSLGQAAPAPPPLLVIKPTYPQVRVTGEPEPLDAAEARAIVRRAAPVGDIRNWLPASDPAVTTLNAGAGDGAVSMDIHVASDGQVVGCEVGSGFGEPGFQPELCERVAARVCMVPAVDRNGLGVADIYIFTVYFGRGYEEPHWLLPRPLSPASGPEAPSARPGRPD